MSETKVIAKKAYVAIVCGQKILSSRSGTRRIFLVNTFSGRVPVQQNKSLIVPFYQWYTPILLFQELL